MHVLGTAGHVDHGKSSLVEALSGIDPDRLKEEQERQMTIDLGFAWLTLPNKEEVGIVDVPGHRDFIENMLAGVGGIDAALLVVAADEGVMPQTTEHLAILDLLEVNKVLIAITKADLVEGPEWIDLVEAEIRSRIEGTSVQGARCLSVSAKTGEGIVELISALEELLANTPTRKDGGNPRLGVDRAFTMSGFGTVVTGTLLDGSLEVGQEVEVLPSGGRGRIRGLQTHRVQLDRAHPGSRVAANMSGIDASSIQRGDWVVRPGSETPTARIDAAVRMLRDKGSELAHDQEVKVFIGPAQRMARARILGDRTLLRAGDSGWVQLTLEHPIIARHGDHYIVRRPSPPATLGGGRVVDPHPLRRHRKGEARVVQRLQALHGADEEERARLALEEKGPATLGELSSIMGSEKDDSQILARKLIDGGKALELDRLGNESMYIGHSRWDAILRKAHSVVRNYHGSYPLRAGIGHEELRGKLRLTPHQFSALLAEWSRRGELDNLGKSVAEPDHEFRLSAEQEELRRVVLERFSSAGTAPPTVAEAKKVLGAELYSHLVQRGEIIQVSDDIAFGRDSYESMLLVVKDLIATRGPQTVAAIRDQLGSTRKFVLPFLEDLDQKGITVREGDVRRLKPG